MCYEQWTIAGHQTVAEQAICDSFTTCKANTVHVQTLKSSEANIVSLTPRKESHDTLTPGCLKEPDGVVHYFRSYLAKDQLPGYKILFDSPIPDS